jgi:hypothetical protein
MTISSASYVEAPGPDGSRYRVNAVIDNAVVSVDLRTPGFCCNLVSAWIAAGNVPAPYVAPPAPPVTCALWQLQSVMTADQWTAVQTFIASLNDSAVSAFFAHGTNRIPSNSTTLAKIGAGIGLTADQITALMTQAAEVAIP